MSLGRWVMRGLVLVAVAALLVALVGACKSSKKSDDGGKTPAAAESPSAEETPTDGDGGDDGGIEDLERLASEASGAFAGKITYRTTTESDGQTTEQDWTLAQRPPSDSRFEIVSDEGGEETRTIVIQTAEKSYICSSAAGSESCFESEQTQQYTSLFDPIFDEPKQIAEGTDDLGIADRSERDIAGLQASCFTYSLVGVESEACFSDEGLLLYLHQGTEGSSYTFEATSASTEVSDSDFEPPYEIFELPG